MRNPATILCTAVLVSAALAAPSSAELAASSSTAPAAPSSAELVVSSSAKPFTPKSYIKTVLDASPTMRKAEQDFKQSENSYKAAVLDAALPSFTFSMSDSLYDEQDRRLRLNHDEVSSSLSASWNLYDSASSPLRRIKIARLDYKAARLVLLTAKQAEAVKALNRFYALYSAQRRIGTAKMNLASRERQYKDTNEQFESGTRSRIEVTQSEGDKLQSELSLAQAETAERKALMSFNELINAEPEAQQAVEISTQAADIKLPLPKEDVAKALENNFSLRQQKLSLEKTGLSNRAGVLSNYPRFKVDAAWRKTGLGILGTPGGSGAGNPAYGLGASLSYPFGFLGVQNSLELDVLESALISAGLEIENSARALKTSVLSAQKDIELQVKSRQLLEFQVKAQMDTTDNLLTEYSLGGASFLQLDSSQTKLLDSSNGQITAVNDLDLALANYRVLLGEKIWE
ncbi:MAG: TolC family protein [Elusimicrobiota bacterium]|nr:TolC family protein [Elusimicrobiota bacterium]